MTSSADVKSHLMSLLLLFERLQIERPAAKKGSSAFQPPILWVTWVEGPDIDRRWSPSPEVSNNVFNNLFNVQLGFVEVNELFASSADPKVKYIL